MAFRGDSGDGFQATPRLLDRLEGATTLHLRFAVLPGQQGWELRVYDLWGALVKDFGGDLFGPGPRDLIWDGLDDQGLPVGPGAYVALLELRGEGSRLLARQKILLGVR